MGKALKAFKTASKVLGHTLAVYLVLIVTSLIAQLIMWYFKLFW